MKCFIDKCVLVTILVCLLMTPVSAEVVRVLGKSIPEFLTEDPGSMFVAILNEAATRANLDLRIEVYPGRRSLAMFNRRQGDILAPVPLELMTKGSFQVPVIGSEPIMSSNRHIFTLFQNGVISDLSGLKGKKVGLVRGYQYGNHIDKNQTFTRVMAANVGQLLKMLRNQRIDALVAFPNTVYRFSQQSTGLETVYDETNPITEDSVAFAFHDTARGRYLRDRFSKALIEMKKDGTLQRLTAPMLFE